MEVSQIGKLDTHAVIGGGQAEAFGIDDSPEFYTMLSDTMYRDKNRAAMREIICNGWDAHIDAGLTDTPLEITLTNTEVTIKDVGRGIAPHMMKPIYCIYGRSTKVKRADQTGGFGLGSKAPFAYTDHFTVVSCHAGRRIVYAISKGSRETEGKPDLRPMVDRPTADTGITVTLPLRKAEDRQELDRIIRSVVRQGGINATLNGSPLTRWDYTEARKHGFCTVPNTDLGESAVWLLYGTVLYPLSTENPELMRQLRELRDMIADHPKLVLIAKPNTIGVTPSRESLSYTEDTELTVIALVQQAKRRISAMFPAARRLIADSHVRTQKLGKLSLDTSVLNRHVNDICDTPLKVAEQAVSNRSALHFRDDYLLKRTRLQIVQRQKWGKLRRAAYSRAGSDALNGEYNRRLPLRLAARLGLLQDMMGYDSWGARLSQSGKKFRPFASFIGKSDIQPVIYLARNMRDLQAMFSAGLATQRSYDLNRGSMMFGFVVRGWTDVALRKIKEQAEHFKLEVRLFDYAVAKPKPKKVAVQAKYVDLGSLIHSDKSSNTSLADPKFYIMSYARDGEVRRPSNDASYTQRISGRYPKTAVITTKEQREELEKAGAQDLVAVLSNRLIQLSKKRDVLYGFAITSGMLCTSSRGYDVADTAIDIAKIDFKLAKLIFPDRATPGEGYIEADRIYGFLQSVLQNYQTPETSSVMSRATIGVTDAITSTFKRMNAKESERQLSYLHALKRSNLVTRYDADLTQATRVETLYETVRFLQRRFKPKAIKPTMKTEPQKEAA